MSERTDFLNLANGKKIEVPFEQLVLFSTNLDVKDLADEAFLRRMGYRARIEPPTAAAYVEILRDAAAARGIIYDKRCLDHLLSKYAAEHRQMKGCEPRDLLDRATDICRFDNLPPKLTPGLIDLAWRNYFGVAHGFSDSHEFAEYRVADQASRGAQSIDPLEL